MPVAECHVGPTTRYQVSDAYRTQYLPDSCERLFDAWSESTRQRQSEEVLLKRTELSLPTKLTGGRLCFTYLGNQKWRVVLR